MPIQQPYVLGAGVLYANSAPQAEDAGGGVTPPPPQSFFVVYNGNFVTYNGNRVIYTPT